MAQGRSAESFLADKPLHSYTYYGSGDDSWVWINLAIYDGRDIKTRPVKLHDDLPEELVTDLHKKRSG